MTRFTLQYRPAAAACLVQSTAGGDVTVHVTSRRRSPRP